MVQSEDNLKIIRKYDKNNLVFGSAKMVESKHNLKTFNNLQSAT